MQIQISWLLQKPTDLDLHCLLRQGMSCSAREGLRFFHKSICWRYSLEVPHSHWGTSNEYHNICFYGDSIIPELLSSIPPHQPASVAQLDAPSDWRPGGSCVQPRRGRQHSFVEIDHEIFSTVILSLPLIQDGQLSVCGERMCTIPVNRLRGLSLPSKRVVR